MSWSDVTLAIPTVPERSTMVHGLVEALINECPRAAVILHEHEPGTLARVDFPALAARALVVGKPWTLFLEDDVVLAPGFGTRANDALKLAEAADAVTLFSRSKRDLEFLERGSMFRRQAPASFSMSQAIAVRTELLRGFAAWAPSWYEAHPEHNRAADLLLGAWLSLKRATLLVHVPSLVQHRRGPSTLPNHRGARQSESFRKAFGEVA